MSVLEQLKQVTVVVADTGDFEGKTYFTYNITNNSDYVTMIYCYVIF